MNKLAINAYKTNSYIADTKKDISVKIIRSLLSYLDNAVELYNQDNSNCFASFDLLDKANRLTLETMENLAFDLYGTEVDYILTQTVESIKKAIGGDYKALYNSRKDLSELLKVIQLLDEPR